VIIVVNGESREVAEGLGLTDLLREMELPPEQRGIASRGMVTWCSGRAGRTPRSPPVTASKSFTPFRVVEVRWLT